MPDLIEVTEHPKDQYQTLKGWAKMLEEMNDRYDHTIGGRPFNRQMQMTQYHTHVAEIQLYWIDRMKNLVRDQEDF